MALWVCTNCTCRYAVGLDYCPECGWHSRYAREEGDDVARVNVHGNPTDRLRPELKRGDDVSDGNSSSASPERQPTSPEPSEHDDHKPAKRMANPSGKGRGARSTARSAAETTDE